MSVTVSHLRTSKGICDDNRSNGSSVQKFDSGKKTYITSRLGIPGMLIMRSGDVDHPLGVRAAPAL